MVHVVRQLAKVKPSPKVQQNLPNLDRGQLTYSVGININKLALIKLSLGYRLCKDKTAQWAIVINVRNVVTYPSVTF